MSFTYTIGIAGHIDHGKTSLTRALTHRDTDRLPEEKRRAITIEVGYAPLKLSNGETVGVIDVPGHERFIRQMIAGVAGIDLVVLVIAADEGVMPQTIEHVEILQLLGMKKGIIVLSKVDLVDEDWLYMVEEDVHSFCEHTFLAGAPILRVNSLTGAGVDQLKTTIADQLANIPLRDIHSPVRMPIDRVFTVKGVGTVVTGTIYEGYIDEGKNYEVLPQGKQVRIKQLQSYYQPTKRSFAGQRTACNLGGMEKEEIKRGDVIVEVEAFTPTQRIDVSLHVLSTLDFSSKQRSLVRFHTGTQECLGHLIFFDRNEASPGDEVLCQLLLEEPVVVKKDDHFIIRRPTPMTTIGGGQVIEPHADKHRFGEATIIEIQRKREADPSQLLFVKLEELSPILSTELVKQIQLSDEEYQSELAQLIEEELVVKVDNKNSSTNPWLTAASYGDRLQRMMEEQLGGFHRLYPLRQGISKATLKDKLNLPNQFTSFFDGFLQILCEKLVVKIKDDKISLRDFEPQLTSDLKKQIDEVLNHLKDQGIEVSPWSLYWQPFNWKQELIDEVTYFLLDQRLVQRLNDDLIVSEEALEAARLKLHSAFPTSFTLQDAKGILPYSRKYLVPLLEWLDREGWTRRREQERFWIK